jgi:hypothetical protein
VLDRIPFGHVDDPLSKARLAAAADAGRNGFLEVTLPPAAVLLAQGPAGWCAPRRTAASSWCSTRGSRPPATAAPCSTPLPPFYRARSKDGGLASLRAIDASAPDVLPAGPAAVRAPPALARA